MPTYHGQEEGSVCVLDAHVYGALGDIHEGDEQTDKPEHLSE